MVKAVPRAKTKEIVKKALCLGAWARTACRAGEPRAWCK
jgi:hypothetical protein